MFFFSKESKFSTCNFYLYFITYQEKKDCKTKPDEPKKPKMVSTFSETTYGDGLSWNEPKKPDILPVVDRALSTDQKCRQFHGIPLFLFNLYIKGLQGQFITNGKFQPKEQLSMVFYKLKTNLSNGQIGNCFNICLLP